MGYVYLALAIILEVLGSSLIKVSDGFTKIIPTSIMLIAYVTCFYFLSLTLKTIPLGIAYAIWGGLGIVLTAIISVVIFKQNLDLPAILGIALIVSGVFIMNFFSKTNAH
ncbi:MAG TPA: multidrug efflux SMR transporter [Chitinophagales bacterium]|nr:multidrug efflux SMR transporter [Chitinophagales bacterium]MCB0511753.1 multidrug efflux SMR transporter [Bacteroidota bacterium]MCB9075536.1 multidrug efflux SMR transporter [Chitinophagales bacterium]HMU98859.1 multidrug efflux SMR transporter [Chitinophagales bacterium]HMV03517.1 multidrug efflux SMR transporter [Chitinophagales bacterium]